MPCSSRRLPETPGVSARAGTGLALAIVTLLVASPSSAFAADDETKLSEPTVQSTERPKVKKAVMLASANLGLLVTSGNSNVTTVTGGAFMSWKDPSNRFTFDGSVAFASQHVLTATDTSGDGLIQRGEIRSESKAGAQNWYVKPRYDRYFSDADSVYIAPAAASDILAGKKLTAGGQLGYSRIAYSAEPHEIVAEIGYDFTHERYVEPVGSSLNVHSSRLFSSYRLKLADDIFLQSSLEFLSNIFPEQTPTGDVDRFVDNRLNWKNLLSAKVWRNISGRFTFTARFDNVPAARPEFDLPYADGVVVPANKLDTQTELAVVVNFL